MYVRSGHDTEIRLTLETAVDLVNALGDGAVDVRALLHDSGFTRAASASEASVLRLEQRMRSLSPTLRTLAHASADDTITWINEELTDIDIAPSLTTHDDAPLHIHWTPNAAKFDDQVMADILMSLAQEVCDHGTERFGTCAAVDCEHLFYDATRNRSRRFCNDPRCASRTHTADHRARRRRD